MIKTNLNQVASLLFTSDEHQPLGRGALIPICCWLLLLVSPATAQHPVLSDTQPLTLSGDIASKMIDGVDAYLLTKTSETIDKRSRHWKRDFSSVDNYRQSLQPNRDRLASILGVVEKRSAVGALERGLQLAQAEKRIRITAVRWPVLEDPDPGRSIVSVYADGLLIEPLGDKPAICDMIVIPDCQQSLQSFCGLEKEGGELNALPLRLAQANCRVLVPLLISRHEQARNGRSVLTNREYLYRAAFILGRHVIGYEVQKVQAAVDWLQANRREGSRGPAEVVDRPLGVVGLAEGGRIALVSAALDNRIDGLCLCGSFGPMEQLWQEPIDRNVFGLLDQFGGAELLSMIAPRPVRVVHCPVAEQVMNNRAGGAPGEIRSISYADGHREVERARELLRPWGEASNWSLQETNAYTTSENSAKRSSETYESLELGQFLGQLLGAKPESDVDTSVAQLSVRATLDEPAMQQRAVEELDRHNQLLLRESPFVRDEFMRELKTDSLANFEESVERYRERFRHEVIGHFEEELLPFNARVRQTWDSDKWTGTEVVLDVFPDVMAYGVLLLPKDLRPDEQRPVVVCQHGLEGRPTDTFLGDHAAYHDFAARLCEQGYIVFAPQNLYLFKDRFRSLQRKANPLGKTLFSIIVPQHQQIVNWLKTLPNVDPRRIGFYGLSYGGKSAMRIPALVTDYSLSICSADFNEWVLKNASTRDRFSYVWTGEYEIFEWNLGNTFNYAEMAALICPRPFMVERGHFDGVGEDHWVAYEYAKVRRLYAAQLKIGERTEIEWFVGPHTINGQKTFEFLNQHLSSKRGQEPFR